MPPTPTPWGYPDVVAISGMYVAGNMDGIGCAEGEVKEWVAASS